MNTAEFNPEDATVVMLEGGGSHTRLVVMAASTVLVDMALPSLNRVGLSGYSSVLAIREVVQSCRKFTNADACYMALGAAATQAYLARLWQDFQREWVAAGHAWRRVILTNDIVPLLFAADDDANQVVAISGTGSGVAARRGFKEIVRAGANEYLLGDEGGAYDIGCRGLKAVLAARDGRGRTTVLQRRAAEWSNGEEIQWFVYESISPKQTIASFAPEVFGADAEGDPIAAGILDSAARELARTCRVALAQLGRPTNVMVTCTGSLLCEPTGRLRTRLVAALADDGIKSFENATVDAALLQRAATKLFSSPPLLARIASAVPAMST